VEDTFLDLVPAGRFQRGLSDQPDDARFSVCVRSISSMRASVAARPALVRQANARPGASGENSFRRATQSMKRAAAGIAPWSERLSPADLEAHFNLPYMKHVVSVLGEALDGDIHLRRFSVRRLRRPETLTSRRANPHCRRNHLKEITREKAHSWSVTSRSFGAWPRMHGYELGLRPGGRARRND
jgi:hypothetical protein